MMRALFAGVTGLRSHQTKMDVIGNNISNVNTLGFKKSAANFADLYSETTAAATGPAANKGGTNASQVGLGVTCNAIVVKHTPGAAQYTGNTLDLAISGDGYFSVRVGEDGNMRYTRDGALHVTSNGSLVTSSGYFVQCFNSMYRQGNAGTVTGKAGLDKASATGFQDFEFFEGSGLTNAPSGTYSFELNDQNQVVVYKNGVQYGDNACEVREITRDATTGEITLGDRLMAGVGFKSNQEYQITLPENLGTIRFKAQGQTLLDAEAIPKAKEDDKIENVTFDSSALEDVIANLPPCAGYTFQLDAATNNYQLVGTTKEIMDLPAGYDAATNPGPFSLGNGYSLAITPQVDQGVTTGYKMTVSMPTQTDRQETVTDANGTTTIKTVYTENGFGIRDASGKLMDLTAAPTLQAGKGYTLVTPIGEYSFVPKEPIGGADANEVVNTVLGHFSPTNSQVKFPVEAPTTVGGDTKAFNAGIGYLNSLLMSATVTVANNDGFYAGSQRGDMVINPDLYENVMITEDGAVVAQLKRRTTPENVFGAGVMGAGERVTLGYLAMANFTNPEGLEKIGTNLYQTTANSGQAMYTLAGENGVGALATSSLEMSNVDLSEEMVNMITTQRGFQANSRIITVTDTMLEELINLKR